MKMTLAKSCMKGAVFTLFSLFAVTAAQAGQFHCTTFHLVTVEIFGHYSDDSTHALNGDLLVTIENEPIPVEQQKVGHYENTVQNSKGKLHLVALDGSPAKPILDLDTVNGQGTLTLDAWGITLDHAPTFCTF